MDRYARWNALLELLTNSGRVSVEDAADRLDVSQATIRRDFDQLAQQQMITRTRGGAVANGVSYDLPLRYKTAKHSAEKQRIGAAAAALVSPGMVVGLNGGTTTTEVARALSGRPGLRVVTNALNIASELAVRSNIELVVCGGSARAESYELVGPLAELTLAHLNLDLAFIGVDGISPAAGLTTHHEVEAQTNRALVHTAARAVVVADSSKLGRRGFAKIGDLALVSDLITDSAASPDTVDALRRAGIEVHLIDVP